LKRPSSGSPRGGRVEWIIINVGSNDDAAIEAAIEAAKARLAIGPDDLLVVHVIVYPERAREKRNAALAGSSGARCVRSRHDIGAPACSTSFSKHQPLDRKLTYAWSRPNERTFLGLYDLTYRPAPPIF
jgi:hypothetical protein